MNAKQEAPLVGEASGERDLVGSAITSRDSGHNPERQVDTRLAFLLRAAAKLHLIEAGYQDLDSAFNDLVVAFRDIAVPPCECEAETLAAIERHHLKQRQQWLRDWRWRPRQ